MARVMINGGGIAGLCAASALLQKGIEVKVYERSSGPTEAGAGIIIAPNAIQALERIGIAEAIIRSGLGNDGLYIKSNKGRHISKLTMPEGLTMYSIHRKDLHAILHAALPQGTVEYGKECVSTEQNKQQVKLYFRDGSEASGSLLIAADGIHSPIRKQWSDQPDYRYAGYTCWRGVVSTKTLPNLSSEFIETWGTRGRFGIVPLPHDQVYWYAMINAAENDPKFSQFTVEDLAQRFEHYHPPIPELLSLMDPAQLIHRDVQDIVPMQRFYVDRIAFIGDAAHAFTPNLGQGACQAIEDAIRLADALGQQSSYKQAFASFDAARRKRITWISNQSWTLGHMAQMDHSVMATLRNMVMRYTPKSLYRKQFYDLYKFPLT